jgi:hypothetical protein
MSQGDKVLLIFQSIHQVLAAEETLRGAGVACDLVPVPKEIDPNCGMAITIAPADRPRGLRALARTPPARALDDWVQ